MMRKMHTTVLLSMAILTSAAVAQDGYRQPSDDIVKILKAPPLPGVSVDPTSTTMMLTERRSMPGIDDMSQPMLRLAGQRINPNTNGRHGTTGLVGIVLQDIKGGNERRVALPEGARISSPRWSPDGSMFAFTNTRDNGIELWVGQTSTGAAKKIADNINELAGGFSWLPDGERLLVHFIPAGRGNIPQASPVPIGPIVQESSGRTSPVRTYQDLLKDPHDEALFEHFFTSQVAIVDARSGQHSNLFAPAIYRGMSVSPDGKYILGGRITRPYSYLVPMWSFPTNVEIWDLSANRRMQIAKMPMADQVPIGGVLDVPRSHQWKDSMGDAVLLWVEALDGGDPKREVDERDKLMMLSAPFRGQPTEVARFEDRFSGLTWFEDSTRALASEYDRDDRWSRQWIIDVASSDEPKLFHEQNSQDRYADIGRPVTTTNAAGRSVIDTEGDGDMIFLSGRGATPMGDRPFLDIANIADGQKNRVWQNTGESYETFVERVGNGRFVTRYETPVEPPNYFMNDSRTGERTQLTHFEHPAPQLRDVTKQLVRYKRSDGVDLSATLYLPPDYQEGQRLPLIVWAYPREFNDARTAGQVSGSPYRFTSIGGSSHLFLLLEGYAIMDSATMPVVGSDPETVNDSFIDQIVASAKAAIDYAADRGVADPTRVGVGGHSYGAFMTANLLAHCDLFNAGIARSGAYNRTLTPFGFQSERRTFWEAPDVYFNLSPFMHADQIDEPILLIHGMRDNNSGTFPIQSERLYHAVKGHGGTVRYVQLPMESHGYRAEESIMHTLAEMIEWMNRHVKSGPGRYDAGTP